MMDWAVSDDADYPASQSQSSSRRSQPPPLARPSRHRRLSSSSSSASAVSDLDTTLQSPAYHPPHRSSGSSMTRSRRMRDPRPTMDVKVLYTLDASPDHTMVARMGRPVPVDVIRPAAGRPSSPAQGSSSASSPSLSPPRPCFGRVTLKACLSTICIASPELIFDRKRDYIIYAVDPEETFRAAQQRSPTGPPRSYLSRAASGSVTQGGGHHAESSKAGATAAAETAAASASPSSAMLVGKGYFSWGLEEDGNGETIVSGKVRSEGTRSIYRDGRLVDESIDVLEVVLKMKETQARSKEQYFSLVRGFGASSSGSTVEPSPASASYSRSGRPLSRQSAAAAAESRASRSMQLRSEPDYHHARDRHSSASSMHSLHPYQQHQHQQQHHHLQRSSSRRSLAPAGDVFERSTESLTAQGRDARTSAAKRPRSSAGDSVMQPHPQPHPMQPQLAQAPTPTAAAATAPAISAANPQAIQLLALLQTLQSHQSQPGQQAPAPQQQAQLSSLLGLVAGALGASDAGAEAADQEGGATGPTGPPPIPQQQQQLGPELEQQQPVLDAVEALPSNVRTIRSQRSNAAVAEGKENREASQSASTVTAAGAGFVGGGAGKGKAASSAGPLAEGTSPAWSAVNGSGAGDNETGDKSVQSRNRNTCYNCGTTESKTWRLMTLPVGTQIAFAASEKNPSNIPTSEYVYRFAKSTETVEADGTCRWAACNPCSQYFLKWDTSRPKHIWEKEHRSIALRQEAALAKRAANSQAADDKQRKRVKVSQTDDEAACSPTYSVDNVNTPTNSVAGGTSMPGSDRKTSLPRTLSEACQREADRIEHERLKQESRRESKRETNRRFKDAQRTLVQDENGEWRTRRSIRENPTGRKAGRPKGSTKKKKEEASKETLSSSNAVVEQGGADNTPASAPAATDKGGAATKPSSALVSAASARSSLALPRSRKDTAAAKATTKAAAASTSTSKHSGDAVFRAPAPPLAATATAAAAAAAMAAAMAAPETAAATSSRIGRTIADAGNGRTVSFAQSSPVRPSFALRNPTDAFPPSAMAHSTPFDSPSRDLRFGVPNYLLNSSPGTMMDTLMSEADFDFEELGPANLFSTPGSLIGLGGPGGHHGTPTPLRRSPRKNPGGTKSDQNPFATHIEPASPLLGQSSARAFQGAQRLTFSSDESPVTRSRTRSGQGVLHPALFSSSDSPTGGKQQQHQQQQQQKGAKSSSNVTSPISPGPKRKANQHGGSKARSSVHAHAAGSGAGGSSTSRVQMAARKPAILNRASGKATLLADGLGNDEDDDDADEEQLTKGPYQGGRSPGRLAGRSTRNAQRGSQGSRATTTASAAGMPTITGAARLSHLDLPPSSPLTFDHPTTESANFADVEVDGWGRTPSMRELFPTPSDVDWASDDPASPTKPDGQAAAASQDANKAEAAAAVATATQTKTVGQLEVAAPTSRRPSLSPYTALVPLPPTHVARRPLPATVEDASTTSGSSPEDNDSPDQDQGSNAFELFDDPYGLLAASGFGVQASGMTAEAFNNVELHQSMEFGRHLDTFTQHGGVGVAAHVAGPAGGAVVEKSHTTHQHQQQQMIAPSTSSNEMTIPLPSCLSKSTVPPMPSTPSTSTGDMTSFFSSLATPADLTALVASPGKSKMPQHIIDTLLSPRGRSHSSTGNVTTRAGGEMVVSAGEAGEGQEDLLALLNNPDIQAMLAEFGDLLLMQQQQQQRGGEGQTESVKGKTTSI